MNAIASTELIAELESAVKGGSPQRRVQMLRQVTDLFLSGTDRLNTHQIEFFDDVLVRLMERIEAQALSQLSTSLADSASAPKEAVRRLAYHQEAAVAVPILLKSDALSESDLIEIAGSRGQQHLLAISGRKVLNEAVTDVLLKRGDTSVCRVLANNAGAHFSDLGYTALVASADRDGSVAESLSLRLDIPARMLRELLARATEAARSRLLKAASPEMRERIQAAIEGIAAQISAKIPEPIDYSEAESTVLALSRTGKLNDSAVNRFALRREHTNVVAALSLLSAVTIEAIKPLMEESGCNGLIVACRASRLSWPTTLAVINNRTVTRRFPKQEIEQGKEVFETLTLSAAQRTIRFWFARSSAMKPDTTDKAFGVGG
jgi:uncharacterized protein (DUF2336 family)